MTNPDPQPTQAAASALLDELIQAWARGDGLAFGRPFAERCRFVAFDGTILQGPEEIARFHQQAFNTHVAGTRLQLHIDEIRALGPSAVLVLARGGIERDWVRQGALIGDSIQTFVITHSQGRAQIEAFQNTRWRPISGPAEAQVWRDFDQAWFGLPGSRRSSMTGGD